MRKQAFLHIILSHHGQLEHGSPVVPQTREAFLVHTMDNLGGKLGIIDRLEQERQPGSQWSGFDRAFGGSVWFAEPPAAAAATGAEPAGAGEFAGESASTSVPVPAAPPAPAPAVEPVVPRTAFEDSDAWQPPHPDQLTAPPLPDGPFTRTPDHTGAETLAAQRASAQPKDRPAPPDPEPLPF